MRGKCVVYDVKTGQVIEKEEEYPEPKAREEPIRIDLRELAQVIEDVKRIKEKLGLK